MNHGIRWCFQDVFIDHFSVFLCQLSRRFRHKSFDKEAAAPISTVPLGERLLRLVDCLQETEQGLRALRGAPYREAPAGRRHEVFGSFLDVFFS